MNAEKKYALPIVLFLLFETIAIALCLSLDNIFYFYNFTYIGGCLALGFFLYIKKWKHSRLAVQFAIGLYMLLYLGLFSNENMQIEGFWYYLFLGVFEAATIHYAVAKLFGPVLFGRGWCGYACWTAMILDLLPYHSPQTARKNWGCIRYITFTLALVFVGALFVFHVPNLPNVMFWSFIIGNSIYYALGIALAFACKDNRAFCKYICPITVFLKPLSYFSLLRIKHTQDTCISCGKCAKVCPMNVEMTNNSRTRINGTECILCFRCIDTCPKKSLHI